MEYWDLYDENRHKLNRKAKRGDYLQDSEYHLVVNAWIKNAKGEFLITQRSANKSHPLMWECTGGSALMGEGSLEAAKREVKEELGIDISDVEGIFVGSTKRYYEGCPDILDVWLFHYDVSLDKVKIQKEEVNDVKWASRKTIKELYDQKKFEANAYFEDIIGKKDYIYYIGLNANNAICNDNFFAGSITLYNTKEKGNIYFSDKFIEDTKSDIFMQKYYNFVYQTALEKQKKNPNTYFICFNEKIRKLCQKMSDINIIKSNSPEILDLLNDKFKTRELFKKYMPILEYKYFSGIRTYEEIKEIIKENEFVLQGQIGAGGDNTYLVTSSQNLPPLSAESNYCVSKYVINTPLNITLVIYDDKVLFLQISAQLILLTDHKFKYVGGDFIYPQNLDKKIIDQINKGSLQIAKDLQNMGYRGILGIDFVLKDGVVYFMEINPRFQASSFLISQALRQKYNIDIAKLHCDALMKKSVSPIKIGKIDYSFLNCNESEDFRVLCNYEILDKGYFKDNKSSVYRKIFNHSIINLLPFEKENK